MRGQLHKFFARFTSFFTGKIDNFFSSKFSIYIILTLAALIVLPNISRESLWLDEIFSANISLRVDSLAEMFTRYIFKDVHPPLYHMLLYYWGRVAGPGDFSIRFLSFLSILTSFSISYHLLDKYFSRRIAILFIALSTFTPGVLYYAQEARPYALLYCLANLLSILYTIFITNIKADTPVNKSLLILYSILGVLLCYTHFFGYILIFSLSAALVLYALVSQRKTTVKYLLISSFLIAGAGIIWLFIQFYYGDLANKTSGHFWIKNNYLTMFLDMGNILLGNLKMAVLEVPLLLFILLPPREFLHRLKGNWLLIIPAILSAATAFTLSLHTPITTGRNLIIIIPSCMIFLSLLLDSLYSQKKLLISLYIALLLISSSWGSFTYRKQNWRDASAYIKVNFSEKGCRIPTRSGVDKSTGQKFSMYTSYYLGDKFFCSGKGPEVQDSCDLLYFDGHISKEDLKKTLTENKINVPYKILDFYYVYVVVKSKINGGKLH